MVSISVATWNTQWATPSSDRGPRISSILAAIDADIIVVAEGVRDLLPKDGYAMDAGPDWGYGPQSARRKVIVWTRFPLTQNFIGVEGATHGRLAVATVDTPAGPLRIVGVCIPWRDAHVSTGRGDAAPWSEHMDYIDRLSGVLAELDDDIPTVIAGDYNQRVPRGRQPIRVADRLGDVFGGWMIHTAGAQPNGPHIDHIATRRGLAVESVHDWAATDHLGRLSDHAGVTCRLVSGGGATVGKAATAEAMTDQQAAQQESNNSTGQERGGVVTLEGQVQRADDGALTPEMRAEIEAVLRSSGDGLEHGAAFRLREHGYTDAEIAAARGVQLGSSRVWLRSLRLLLSGELPKSKSAALTNSYVYRELLKHTGSGDLDRYVMATLRKLKELNPEVSFEPLNTRPHPYGKGNKKARRQVGKCSCGMELSVAGTCGYCC